MSPTTDQGDPSAHPLRNRLTGQSAARPDRLPGLAHLFEDISNELATQISPLFVDAPHCRLDGVEPARLADFLSPVATPRFATLHAAEVDARAFVVFEGPFDLAMIDAVFGAGSHDSIAQSGAAVLRRRTRTGDRFAAEMGRSSARALEAAFSKFCRLTFRLEQLTDLDPFMIEKHQIPMIAARITIKTKTRECSLALLLPEATVGQMRNALPDSSSKADGQTDPFWNREFEHTVIQTPLGVSAVMEDLELTLAQVADLKIGQTLPLRGAGMGRVRLFCNGQELFRCRMRRSDERYVLEIE